MGHLKQRERIIVFDVNETLLDIEALSPFFERVFGDAWVMRQWFAELILYSQALTLSERYTDFGELAIGVLTMVAEIRGVALQAKEVDSFKALMSSLPAHPDAAPALQLLRDAGFRLVTLTNSAAVSGEAVLEKAGLARYFEVLFSVDSVKHYKPSPKTYQFVATTLGVDTKSLRLVAAHTWDTLGATAAGWSAALLTRPGNAPLRVGEQPDIIAKDLLAIAKRIIDIDD